MYYTKVFDINLMVGLQGSGKSSYVNFKKQIKSNKNVISFSADQYRQEYPEENNEKIFNRLYTDLEKYIVDQASTPFGSLGDNIHFIYLDNTNVTIKSRKAFFEKIQKIKEKLKDQCAFITRALILNTPFEVCLERIEKRKKETGKNIPVDVITKYRNSFHIPFYEEGFDDIKIIDGITFEQITAVQCDNGAYAAKMYEMINFDQENPHHKYTLGVHMTVCQNFVFEKWAEFYNAKCMFVAAGIHDWGKYYTKTYNEKGYGIYYNHGEVGTYELLSHLELIPQNDFTIKEILRILAYVNYHMRPFDWQSDSTYNKAIATYGSTLVHDLQAFNKIDREACGTESEAK